MMQRKKEENYRRRKRKNIDIINDSDDVIAELIQQMKQAADVRFGYMLRLTNLIVFVVL